MQKFYIPLLFLGVLALALLTKFYYKPVTTFKMNVATSSGTANGTFPTATSSAETANWKTYENNKYKFSFKYHSDWNLVFQPEHNPVPPNQSGSFNLANFPIKFPVYDLGPNKMMIFGYTYQPKALIDCVSNAKIYKSSTPITVDGVQGVEYNTTEEDKSGEGDIQNAKIIALPKNGLCYILEMTPITTDPVLNDNFEEFLSTFKFL